MFSKEQHGLELLESTKALRTPSVISLYDGERHSCLILEYLESATRSSDYWQKLGIGLANVHRTTASTFGLETDNFMGSLEQSNQRTVSWIDFFVNERIQPQVRLALARGNMTAKEAGKVEDLCAKLPQLVMEEQPALTHGDLWSGNIMTDNFGQPVLIDPAVSYSHRETDIAMTTLFGRLPEEFYQTYTDAFKLDPGWQERLDIYNLYPLLVHVNLFGGGYLAQVMGIVKRYN